MNLTLKISANTAYLRGVTDSASSSGKCKGPFCTIHFSTKAKDLKFFSVWCLLKMSTQLAQHKSLCLVSLTFILWEQLMITKHKTSTQSLYVVVTTSSNPVSMETVFIISRLVHILPRMAAAIAQVNSPGEGANVSAPPSSTTELAPLRSSPTSSSSTSSACTPTSPTKPRESGASSAPWSSVPWSQTVRTWHTDGGKEHKHFVSSVFNWKSSTRCMHVCTSYLLGVVWRAVVHVWSCSGLHGLQRSFLCGWQLELVRSKRNHGLHLCECNYLHNQRERIYLPLVVNKWFWPALLRKAEPLSHVASSIVCQLKL